MLSEVQPHASAVSAVHGVASVYAVQGSAGVAPHPHGAQAAPTGQAGQPQTDPGPAVVLPLLPPLPVLLTVPVAPPLLAGGAVIVVVAPLLHEQLQGAQSAPAGHSGQLQVQVPVPPAPLAPPVPVVTPQPPGRPQPHAQAGQASPGGHAGQSQVQVPPPPTLPPSAAGGGGQSHWTGGQAPLAGQASGCTQRQLEPEGARVKQNPLSLQV
jgi:hypothetical protein